MFQRFLARGAAIIGITLFWMGSAIGGIISFSIDTANRAATIINTGDSAVYSPRVFTLDPAGKWLPLPTAGESTFYWRPQEALNLVLPSANHAEDAQPLASLHVLMLCFVDQAGVEFNQFVFLDSPPHLEGLVNAGYENGELVIHPPEKRRHIAATWVLWAREEGTGPIAKPIRLQNTPPSPQYIRWADVGIKNQTIDTGHRLPAAYLVNQVVINRKSRLILQMVPGGKQGSEQKAWWLSHGPLLYRAGGTLFSIGATLLLLPVACALRKRQWR